MKYVKILAGEYHFVTISDMDDVVEFIDEYPHYEGCPKLMDLQNKIGFLISEPMDEVVLEAIGESLLRVRIYHIRDSFTTALRALFDSFRGDDDLRQSIPLDLGSHLSKYLGINDYDD